MNLVLRARYLSLSVTLLFLALPFRAFGDLIIATGVPVTEDFNTLARSGTSSTLPKDWTFVEKRSGANLLYAAGTGSSTVGDTYSFGSSSSTERALGSLASSSLESTFGSKYTNATGVTIGFLEIAFDGEQWRSGGTSSGLQHLDFQYSLNATSLSTGSWMNVDALDIFSTINNKAAGALDGNAAANRKSYAATISGLSIASSADFWVRFVDVDDPSVDHGLAVDNFSVKATATPEPSSVMLGILGVLLTIGHRGVTALRLKWASLGPWSSRRMLDARIRA